MGDRNRNVTQIKQDRKDEKRSDFRLNFLAPYAPLFAISLKISASSRLSSTVSFGGDNSLWSGG